MTHRDSKALNRIKDIMWALAFAGLVVGVGRFAFGLAASTNMMDSLPWGWWKIFNMVAGAALATSGFVVAAVIYILQLKRYRPVARLSVVIGFLGYGSSLSALIFDIGLPHRGWHPFFMWNPHSFLFEVFWCVSIYWGVTALELLPILTERFPLKKVTHWLHEKMLPFVVLGITLSTMHHSSLGSLFMTSPTRLHPLWYSLWIPPEFFISAMGAGLSVIVLLLLVASWLYGWKRDPVVLNGLAKGSAAFLALYIVIKALDFTFNHKWNFVFGPDVTWESYLFQVEFLLQAIIPVLILSVPAFRRSLFGLILGTGSAFVGLVMHRVDTGIVGYFTSSGAVYIPALSEFVLSFGVLSAAGLVFFFLMERFHILEEPAEHATDDHAEVRLWTKEEAWALLTGPGAQRVMRILVIFIPLTWIALRDQATSAYQPILQPVSNAVRATDTMRTKLRIDANRNGMVTDFDHKKHQVDFVKIYKITEQETCQKCHHLSLPQDQNTSCRRCHRDMELTTNLFNIDNHRSRFETEADYEKFLAVDLTNRHETFKACAGCHAQTATTAKISLASSTPSMTVVTSTECRAMRGLASLDKKGFSPNAPGYKHAMHGSCLTCHRLREEEKKEDPASPTSRGNCLFCHRDWADDAMVAKMEKEAKEAAAKEKEEKVSPPPEKIPEIRKSSTLKIPLDQTAG